MKDRPQIQCRLQEPLISDGITPHCTIRHGLRVVSFSKGMRRCWLWDSWRTSLLSTDPLEVGQFPAKTLVQSVQPPGRYIRQPTP